MVLLPEENMSMVLVMMETRILLMDVTNVKLQGTGFVETREIQMNHHLLQELFQFVHGFVVMEKLIQLPENNAMMETILMEMVVHHCVELFPAGVVHFLHLVNQYVHLNVEMEEELVMN